MTGKSFAEWSENNETSVIWQDVQHKGLYDYMYMANNAIIFDDHNKYRELLNYMKFYVSQHFETEERYMQELGDPEYEVHLKEHNDFREKIDDIIAHAEEEGDKGIKRKASSLLYELWMWYTSHIKKIDQRLGKLIRESDLF